jgi:hypothetical protein
MEPASAGVESEPSNDHFTLRRDLEEHAISRFDELVATQQIIYEASAAETVEDKGFQVSLLHRLL